MQVFGAALKPAGQSRHRRFVELELGDGLWTGSTVVLDNADSAPEWKQAFAVPVTWEVGAG